MTSTYPGVRTLHEIRPQVNPSSFSSFAILLHPNFFFSSTQSNDTPAGAERDREEVRDREKVRDREEARDRDEVKQSE